MITQTEVQNGLVLCVDKPLKWTSFDVIGALRKIFKVKKIGHAGTLDPLATGLLIVCTGRATKKINEYMGMEKEYEGSLVLGAVTPTYDLESEPEQLKAYQHLDQETIVKATKKFIGTIQQVPPAHSAIKLQGKRIYELARMGQQVELKPREVTIHQFEITRMQLPALQFRVVCSTGTYIRSLAYDLGAELGTGAYLSGLTRTRIGNFTLANAKSIEWLAENFDKNSIGFTE
jgi:tRNA pseudouridine55 synthase